MTIMSESIDTEAIRADTRRWWSSGDSCWVAADDEPLFLVRDPSIAVAIAEDHNALLDEIDKLRRGGRQLGLIIERHGKWLVEATHSQDLIDADGDGDWEVVWDRLFALAREVDSLRAENAELGDRIDSLRDEIGIVTRSRDEWESNAETESARADAAEAKLAAVESERESFRADLAAVSRALLMGGQTAEIRCKAAIVALGLDQERCSTCGEPMDAPGCCKRQDDDRPRSGAGFHTVSGGCSAREASGD